MTAIMKSEAGRLIAVKSAEAPQPGLLTVDGLKDGGASDIIITSFAMEANVAYQSFPTIGGPEYLYAFGDKLMSIQVGVVIFASGCGEDEAQTGSYQKAWKFYMEKRVTPRSVTPLTLTFAGLTIYGLVVGLKSDLSADRGSPVIQATISMIGWVDKSTLPGSNSGSAAASTSQDPTAAAGFNDQTAAGQLSQLGNGYNTTTLSQLDSNLESMRQSYVSNLKAGTATDAQRQQLATANTTTAVYRANLGKTDPQGARPKPIVIP